MYIYVASTEKTFTVKILPFIPLRPWKQDKKKILENPKRQPSKSKDF